MVRVNIKICPLYAQDNDCTKCPDRDNYWKRIEVAIPQLLCKMFWFPVSLLMICGHEKVQGRFLARICVAGIVLVSFGYLLVAIIPNRLLYFVSDSGSKIFNIKTLMVLHQDIIENDNCIQKSNLSSCKEMGLE